MASPTSRLLELLELLQARPLTTGREIADRLGIDPRTVRRYVGVLQELGIPVEGQRGVGGGYRIRPGYRLPPLMLGDDEAVVVVLGLLATRGSGPTARRTRSTARSRRSTACCRRRSAARSRRSRRRSASRRRRARAPADAAAVLLLADAIRRRRRLTTAYRSFSGEESERELSPHGLVVHSGRWYLAAYDHTARRPAHVPGRPDVAHGARRAALRPAAGGIRRGRARDPLARQRALDVGGRGAARPAGRRGGAADSRDARRARRRPGRHAPAHARRTRSTGWRPSSPVSAAASRSAGRTSCGRACARSRSG